MSEKTASILSVVLSLLLLAIFAILGVIVQMIALNGASENQGFTAMGVSLLCMSSGALLLGILAWKASALMVTRFNLHPVLALTLTVTLGMLASGAIAFLAMLTSTLVAGIR